MTGAWWRGRNMVVVMTKCCWLCVLLRGVVPNQPGPFLMVKYTPKHTALADDQAREDKNNILNSNIFYFVFAGVMYLLINLI